MLNSTGFNLPILDWQTYEVVVGTTPTQLMPPPLTILDYDHSSGFSNVSFTPAAIKWVRAGQGVTLTGFVADPQMNGKYIVEVVDSGIVTLRRVGLPMKGDIVAATAGSGEQLRITSINAQRAYIAVPSGAPNPVTISPNQDALTNNYGWRKDIAALGERELVSPSGSKFNIGQWYAKVSAGTQTVQILAV